MLALLATLLILSQLGIIRKYFLESFVLVMETEHQIKSVTTRLPPEVYEEFAIAARRKGIPIKEAFEQAIEAWLERPPPQSKLAIKLQRAIEKLMIEPLEKHKHLRDYLVSLLKSDYSE